MTSAAKKSVGSVSRRHRRVCMDRAVGVDVDRWVGSHVRCLDVSRGGVRLRVVDRVSVGDLLVFEASLPGRPAFRIEGEVRSVCRTPEGFYDVGVCWVGSADAAGALLETLIDDARREASDRTELRATGS